MGFSRQESWSGLPFPPADLSNPGIEPKSPVPPALPGGFLIPAPPGKPSFHYPFGVGVDISLDICQTLDGSILILEVDHDMDIILRGLQ